jgi:hypothetical protein
MSHEGFLSLFLSLFKLPEVRYRKPVDSVQRTNQNNELEKEKTLVKVGFRLFDKPSWVWRQMLLATLFLALFNVSAGAQTPKPPPCPTLEFVAPVYDVKKGEPLKLAIKIKGGDPDAGYTYNWTVSDGAIASGQGTEKIEVDTSAAQGATITATVDIGGAPPECRMVKSHTAEVLSKPAALKVYEGNYVSNAELEKQIDELILARIAGDGKGYIIFYAGGKALPGEVKRLTGVALAQLKKRKVDAALFVIIEGGMRATTAFELWVAVPDADPPKPNPAK